MDISTVPSSMFTAIESVCCFLDNRPCDDLPVSLVGRSATLGVVVFMVELLKINLLGLFLHDYRVDHFAPVGCHRVPGSEATPPSGASWRMRRLRISRWPYMSFRATGIEMMKTSALPWISWWTIVLMPSVAWTMVLVPIHWPYLFRFKLHAVEGRPEGSSKQPHRHQASAII